MHELNLSCPRQHDFNDPTVERDAGRLQAWLSNLPIMDVVETVRLVQGALDALNEQRLDPAQRFRLLEIYRTTLQRLFVTLDPLHLRQLSLGKARRQEAVKGLAALFLSLAGGYKLIIMQLGSSLVPGRAVPDLFGRAVNRAVEQLVYALLDSYRFYRALEPFVIAELHQLYRAAHQLGLLDIRIETAVEGDTTLSTAVLYHSGMLLTLTDPSRLAEGEVGLLYDVLLRHTEGCRVVPGNQWPDDGAGLFLIDLQGDAPPRACSGPARPAAAREACLLDARQALDGIRKRLDGLPEKVRMQSPEAMLLRRLLPEASGPGARRAPRQADGRDAQLLLGLENIYRYLMQFATPAAEDGADGSASEPAQAAACRVLDTSESGMKLGWAQGGAGDARIGDLLAVLETRGTQEGLKLAAVRSVQLLPGGGMELGVQLIAGRPAPVTCSPRDDTGQALHALYLPADAAAEIAASLIAATGLYEPERPLLIQVGGSRVGVRTGRYVDGSAVFDRFEFSAG